MTTIGMTNAGNRDTMKDAIWVFKSFGFKAGAIYVVEASVLWVKRLLGLAKKSKRFEDLTDEEARNVAWAFGIFRWQDRQDLNEQFNKFEERVLH